MPLVEMVSEGFAGNGPGNEMSTRYGDTAIIAKHALPIANLLPEDFATALPILTPTEMKTQVTWSWGQRV